MKKIVLIILSLLSYLGYSQDYSELWKGYFSYYDIKDVVSGNNKLYAASENAIFTYDFGTREIEQITTVNGLSGETISTIHFSQAYGLLLIGYENGLIEIFFESDNDVLTVVDILEKPTIPPNNKRINHFNEYNSVVYISTDFGISVYNIEELEFGDTYYIGNLGEQIRVRQTTIFNGFIYAACWNGNGIRKAPLSSPNLINYQEWQVVVGGFIASIQAIQNKLYAFRANLSVIDIQPNDTFSVIYSYDLLPLDVKLVSNQLIVTTGNDVYTYDENFNLLYQVNINLTEASQFTSATTNNGNIYIGTNDLGVLAINNSDTSNVLEIRPDGPLRNDPFSLRAGTNNLWVTYGDYSVFYNPYPLRSRGVSHLENEEWVNIPNDSVLGTRNLNSISINPADSDEVFISSFIDGLLEVNNNEASMLYNQFNSGLESLANTGSQPSDIRLSATNFDSQGILWTATGRVDHPLKSFNPSTGQWQLYDFDDIYIDPFEDEWGYCDLVIDRNGNKWLGGYNQGVIGVSGQNFGQRKMNTEEENMPSPFVTSLAIDQRNQLWIGTLKGLRVLYNTAGFFDDDSPEANSIIILEDDIPSELLFQQFITSIEVDGSNNKWVGTFGTGVFYFSSDGQETIYHFTKDNSPLPSNNITDISIDNTNGIVYFATEKGLLSFSSGSSGTKDDLTEAFIYPNPVRPGFDISEDKVKIKDISDNVNIKIVDIEGNLVAEAQSRTNQRFKGYNLEIDGGTAYWNGKNLANNVVASGVYLVMLSDLDTFETKVLKVMIIR